MLVGVSRSEVTSLVLLSPSSTTSSINSYTPNILHRLVYVIILLLAGTKENELHEMNESNSNGFGFGGCSDTLVKRKSVFGKKGFGIHGHTIIYHYYIQKYSSLINTKFYHYCSYLIVSNQSHRLFQSDSGRHLLCFYRKEVGSHVSNGSNRYQKGKKVDGPIHGIGDAEAPAYSRQNSSGCCCCSGDRPRPQIEQA